MTRTMTTALMVVMVAALVPAAAMAQQPSMEVTKAWLETEAPVLMRGELKWRDIAITDKWVASHADSVNVSKLLLDNCALSLTSVRLNGKTGVESSVDVTVPLKDVDAITADTSARRLAMEESASVLLTTRQSAGPTIAITESNKPR